MTTRRHDTTDVNEPLVANKPDIVDIKINSLRKLIKSAAR